MVIVFFYRIVPCLSIFFLLGCKEPLPAQVEATRAPGVETIMEESKYWVDSVFNSLSERERVAQLFWIAVENPGNSASLAEVTRLVETYQPGGILLFRMDPLKAQEVISRLQALSRVPLLVSIDGEWGLAMRFSGVARFPYAMTLGAIQDDHLVYLMGLEMARQFRLMGIHVNMAPVADVNSNPLNPVIGHRSFGELPCNVARKAVAYMQGLQAGNVMAVGKHFPGHGDTSTDSHYTLPLLLHDQNRLEQVDLPPFQALVDSGAWGMMTAHLAVPVLEPDTGVPASFSRNVTHDLLRTRMGFKGLVITDAVNMEGARVVGKPGVVDALALAAGNDIVLFTDNLHAGINEVIRQMNAGIITREQIEEKSRRSLAFKYWLAARDTIYPVEPGNLIERLNPADAMDLKQKLYDASITVLKNHTNILPLENKPLEGFASVVIGNAPFLTNELRNRYKMPVYNLTSIQDPGFAQTVERLGGYDNLVMIIADSRWGRLSANTNRRNLLTRLAGRVNTITLFMGNAYHLASWKGLENSAGLVLTYQNNEMVESSLARFLEGEIGANGRLPVSIGELFPAGSGLDVSSR